MRRFFPVLALGLLLSAIAAAAAPTRTANETAAGSNAQACSAGSCTRAAPSASTEGLFLTGLTGYRLEICAAAGQTLSGAGTMKAYLYDYTAALWMPAPALDQPVTASGTRCTPFVDFNLTIRFDARVLFAASGVTVSGGTGLDVYLAGY